MLSDVVVMVEECSRRRTNITTIYLNDYSKIKVICSPGLNCNICIAQINPVSPHDALKHHLKPPKTDSPTTKDFRTKISMKLVDQYMAIFFNFPPTSNHLPSLEHHMLKSFHFLG